MRLEMWSILYGEYIAHTSQRVRINYKQGTSEGSPPCWIINNNKQIYMVKNCGLLLILGFEREDVLLIPSIVSPPRIADSNNEHSSRTRNGFRSRNQLRITTMSIHSDMIYKDGMCLGFGMSSRLGLLQLVHNDLACRSSYLVAARELRAECGKQGAKPGYGLWVPGTHKVREARARVAVRVKATQRAMACY